MTSLTRLPLMVRARMILRLFAVQSSWNYETMLGNGLAFALEPALRLLPGGAGGEAYQAALSRHAGYFNAHPYLAGLAVGGLARAELDGVDPARIERVRTACCGPLGSVGDRLVWASWLPGCSLLALAGFGAGLGPLAVIVIFLGTYNAGHVALRVWSVHEGWRQGLNIAGGLARNVFQRGPDLVAQATAALAGIAVPLAVARLVGGAPIALASAIGVAVLWVLVTALVARRVDGWRAALAAVSVYALISLSL